jgi:hypothetical protein
MIKGIIMRENDDSNLFPRSGFPGTDSGKSRKNDRVGYVRIGPKFCIPLQCKLRIGMQRGCHPEFAPPNNDLPRANQQPPSRTFYPRQSYLQNLDVRSFEFQYEKRSE